jgi:hypothetical protein
VLELSHWHSRKFFTAYGLTCIQVCNQGDSESKLLILWHRQYSKCYSGQTVINYLILLAQNISAKLIKIFKHKCLKITTKLLCRYIITVTQYVSYTNLHPVAKFNVVNIFQMEGCFSSLQNIMGLRNLLMLLLFSD